MPTECAIPTCPNNSRRTGKTVSYFTFPKDIVVRKKWILACRRKDKHFNPNFARVCSSHFCETDYVRDLKAELLGYVPIRRFLKKDVYPTLNLRGKLMALSSKMPCQSAANNFFSHDTVNFAVFPVASSHTLSLRQSRAKKREIRKRALDRLRNLSPKLNKPNKDSITNAESIQQVTTSNTENLQQVTTSNIENLQQVTTSNTENLQQVTTSNTENLQQVKTSNMEVIQLTTPYIENVKHNCSKCSMLKHEMHTKTVEFRRLVMQLKIADNQTDIMRKKRAQLEIQNRQLKEMLKTKILFETSLYNASMQNENN